MLLHMAEHSLLVHAMASAAAAPGTSCVSHPPFSTPSARATPPFTCARTGNDFSTLYAPLVRDGRMEKFYWNPTREDRVGVCMGIFVEDPVSRAGGCTFLCGLVALLMPRMRAVCLQSGRWGCLWGCWGSLVLARSIMRALGTGPRAPLCSDPSSPPSPYLQTSSCWWTPSPVSPLISLAPCARACTTSRCVQGCVLTGRVLPCCMGWVG